MKQYHIGFDFGTYQSKACVFDTSSSTHEFIRFDNGKFFLPSTVVRTPEDLLVYGIDTCSQGMEVYRYFKVAAAEDAEFHAETFQKTIEKNSDFYKFSDSGNFTPEFLSVIYITYALLYIKGKYFGRQIENEPKQSLISRLLRRPALSERINFTVQIGIPTEWSHAKNLRRKRKFENILFISELLQKKYKNLQEFLTLTSSRIKEDIKDIQNQGTFKNKDLFKANLNELGISVYPETAAGLTFILKTKQLTQGYYAILDIGGGTSDVSFFRIMDDNTLRYLASESYLMAANNVYSGFVGSCSTMAELSNAEQKCTSLVEEGLWKDNKALYSSLREVNNHINDAVYRLFNRRVYFYRNDMVKKYSDQPIILYGGGARLPILNSGRIMIHDNGCSALSVDHTFLEKRGIDEFTSIINIKPDDGSWKKDFSLLVVSLGLSYIKPESSAEWFNETEYKAKDGVGLREVAHPFNEDLYIYDVLESHFYGEYE